MIGTGLFIELSLVMGIAATFRTAFGFGEALIAVPLLALILPVRESAPLAVLASIVIALIAVLRDWKHIHFPAAKRLLIATAFGIPFGLALLHYGSEGIIKAILGFFLLWFSIFSLRKPNFLTLKTDRLVWLFGFLAGVSGGSYGMNGPPLVIYGTARGWSPDQFRATIQAYFLPASLLGMLGYFMAGLWTKEVNLHFAASLPAIALGIFVGRHVSKTWDRRLFTRLLYGVLILVATLLMLQSVAGFGVS